MHCVYLSAEPLRTQNRLAQCGTDCSECSKLQRSICIPGTSCAYCLTRLRFDSGCQLVCLLLHPAGFLLPGGVLPTLNMDKLPVPLPDTLLLG